MTEYIEREMLKGSIEIVRTHVGFASPVEVLNAILRAIDTIPAADVEPVVNEPCEFCAGTLYNDYALENVNGKYPKIVSCASANRQLGRGQKRFKCCPNCGRKLHMDERSEHED